MVKTEVGDQVVCVETLALHLDSSRTRVGGHNGGYHEALGLTRDRHEGGIHTNHLLSDNAHYDIMRSLDGRQRPTPPHASKALPSLHAVDVGTDQLHPSLRGDERIELHEKADIRDFVPIETPTIVVIDVSFISLRQILPHIAGIVGLKTDIVAMVKPQFEASPRQIGSSGVVKNDTFRRQILRDFEQWSRANFVIVDKADSEVAGAHGI